MENILVNEKQVNSRNAEQSQGFSGRRIEILKCKGSEIYDILASEDPLQHFLIFFDGTLLRTAGDMIREIQKIQVLSFKMDQSGPKMANKDIIIDYARF